MTHFRRGRHTITRLLHLPPLPPSARDLPSPQNRSLRSLIYHYYSRGEELICLEKTVRRHQKGVHQAASVICSVFSAQDIMVTWTVDSFPPRSVTAPPGKLGFTLRDYCNEFIVTDVAQDCPVRGVRAGFTATEILVTDNLSQALLKRQGREKVSFRRAKIEF